MRGKAMLRPLFTAQAAAWGSATLLWLPLPHWLWDAVNDTGGVLFYTSAIGFCVMLMWNIVHPDRESRDERLEAARERQRRMIMEHAGPGTAREQWERAVLEARQAGTFSLNGARQPGVTSTRSAGRDVTWTYDEIVTATRREWEARHHGPQPPGTVMRYPGPPAVFTPPHGMEVVIHVELRAEPKVGWRAGAHVASDECDECGEPMDVAWVKPGTPRVCRPCLTHGMPGYNAPELRVQGHGRPRRGTGAGYRWTSPW